MMMKLDSYNPKPWKISKQNQRDLSIRKVEQALSFFNRAANGNFYVIDYQTRKLIVGASHNPTVAGYPTELIRKENFDFFEWIWAKREIVWFYGMLREAFKIFYAYEDLQMRTEMELSLDMIAIAANQQKIALHYQFIPYDLDENGNLWRSLLHVQALPFGLEKNRASIVNCATGENYDFLKGKFELTTQKSLSDDEIMILECLAKDTPQKQIYEQLGMGRTVFSQKRKSAFEKLGAETSFAAACKAIALGLIRV